MYKSTNPIVYFVNVAFTVFIIIYLIIIAPNSVFAKVIIGISVISAVAQTRFFWSSSLKHRQRYMYLVMINFLYLCIEIMAYLLFVLGLARSDAQFLVDALEANTKPWAKYDSIIGYRALPGQFRNVKYTNSTMVYDHISYINKQGWFSKEDYELYKKNGIKRYAVLGDSFSAGFNIPDAWPDIVSQHMDSIELYNFSLEGIGINNWYLIYFNEVLKYDFDGLIVAISNEQFGVSDLDRKLMIMHSENDGTHIGQFDSLPTPEEFYIEKDFLNKGYSLIEPDLLDRAICGYQKDCQTGSKLLKPDLYFLHTIVDLFAQIKTYLKIEKEYTAYTRSLEARYPADKPIENFDDFSKKYPYVSLLVDIAAHSLEAGKEVILVAIPDYSGASNSYLSKRTDIEMRMLASQLNASYFNGYSIFDTINDTEVNKYYYQYDLHWNQQGANLFAKGFANWLSVENDMQ